ncbi:hypothetical protein H0N95_02635 [Candidatus Micrarchaeota archaeon]|nr:hypothetical protein [Candidatus Micrarchaeota archaeon]
MENASVFLICLIAILGGFVTGQIWLSIIFAAAVFFIIAFGAGKNKEEKPEAVPSPLVRPIIVKRKYIGPASIYPEKMEINYNPDDPPPGYKGKSKPAGLAIGRGLRWLFNPDE